MNLSDLVGQWRADAAVLQRRGCAEQAGLLAAVAGDLEDALARQDTEPVTLAEAERLSGYSGSQLRRLIAQGELENVGTGRDVLLRRGDLPRKPAGKRTDPARAVQVVAGLRKAS